MKAITPVISIIILLFITVAFTGLGYTFMFGEYTERVEKVFDYVIGGSYCLDEDVKIMINNVGTGKIDLGEGVQGGGGGDQKTYDISAAMDGGATCWVGYQEPWGAVGRCEDGPAGMPGVYNLFVTHCNGVPGPGESGGQICMGDNAGAIDFNVADVADSETVTDIQLELTAKQNCFAGNIKPVEISYASGDIFHFADLWVEVSDPLAVDYGSAYLECDTVPITSTITLNSNAISTLQSDMTGDEKFSIGLMYIDDENGFAGYLDDISDTSPPILHVTTGDSGGGGSGAACTGSGNKIRCGDLTIVKTRGGDFVDPSFTETSIDPKETARFIDKCTERICSYKMVSSSIGKDTTVRCGGSLV
ncbi:MAG: hypothetical protein ISS36_02095 [Candidatus Aenigmarchaeota archaeon]|nr:hypothetical protein [Candidatus Aenigmarchaeota archaeon]